jgi:hypothetical protein
VTNNDAATYLLTVSNTQGTVSGSASLTVIPFAAPVITAQPNDLNLSSGYFGQMYIVANGVPNPNYQWRKDGIDVVSGIYSSLVFTNVKEQDAGVYDVIVYNNVGSVTSSGANLTINTGTSYMNMMMATISGMTI